MNLIQRIGRSLSVLALAWFSGLENKERDRRLEERFKRSEEKRKNKL
jgi:predicted GIY-YIG superfamily endonuclease